MKLRIKKDAHCVINYSISFLYSKNFWKNSQMILFTFQVKYLEVSRVDSCL